MIKLIMIFLAGVLYVVVLFVWRFRWMKDRNPNTDLFLLAWNCFHLSNVEERRRTNNCN